MTPAEFKKKWARFSGKETAAYQEHFNDLCAMLGQPSPVSADPTGNDTFCFQKRVLKDAELFLLGADGAIETDAAEGGFADVWKKDCFAWEYKGKKKNLELAYRQLQRYRESLENPPLLVVCDFDRYIIRTNFNGTVQEVHEFTNAQLDEPRNLRVLRALFTDPEFLRPVRTTANVTEELAADIAAVARSLQGRESIAYQDAKTRREQNVALRKNLEIARFLNRIIFCFFAEDVDLLPKGIFTEVTKAGLDDPHFFAERLGELFGVMATGGSFGAHKIRCFNGHLFEDATVFELTSEEIAALATASEADWQFIEPSILGTLFERGLDPNQRAQLGAHYTSRADIETLVEPVLMAPLRKEWKELKQTLHESRTDQASANKQKAKKLLAAFLAKLGDTVVLDPACGSGNFLYVALQMLLDLEKTVLNFAAQLGFSFVPRVDVQQLRAIEINPYAFELAQVAVQIGWLQWQRDNGFPLDRSPVLQTLDGFENADALMREVFHRKHANLKEARTAEGREAKGEKGYVEKAWPACNVIVSNPPFLGGSKLWEELGREYQKELWKVYDDRVPGGADLCCYWFEKARAHIEEKKCRRAGLLATQGIRGGANREVLNRIKRTGDIFFAESDRDWVLAGANVHVSMVGFDGGTEQGRCLDGNPVKEINPNLTALANVTTALSLHPNLNIAFSGTKKAGDFDIPEELACEWLHSPNPHGRPNSDVLRPWLNGGAIVKRLPQQWIIDTGTNLADEDFALYEKPYAHALRLIKPQRDSNKREHRRLNWWLHAETCPGMRRALKGLGRFLTTPRVSKHRIFSWADEVVLPDDGIYVFSRADDYFFGIVHSRIHEVWALAQGTQLREKESGFRYTPTTCFETFPFPVAPPPKAPPPPKLPEPRDPSEANIVSLDGWLLAKESRGVYGSHYEVITAAARELNEFRERWLNPPEWTREEYLEFPASAKGPWARYVEHGVASYPRLVAEDAACAAKLKQRTLTNLYNERPTWLDLLHQKLDAAVAAAYGWPAALPDEEILERLLALNQARAKAEQFTATKKPIAPRAKRDDEML